MDVDYVDEALETLMGKEKLKEYKDYVVKDWKEDFFESAEYDSILDKHIINSINGSTISMGRNGGILGLRVFPKDIFALHSWPSLFFTIEEINKLVDRHIELEKIYGDL